MLTWTMSLPLSVSLFMSLICRQALALPSCSPAIFQRVSLSLTTYQLPPPAAGAEAGRVATSSVTGIALVLAWAGRADASAGIGLGAGSDGVAAVFTFSG